MSGILDKVDQRTNIAGKNRLEILLFHLNGAQRYGINVFKVQEVMQRPHLSCIPMSHPAICGVATVRGKTIPVIDLSMAIGQQPLSDEEGTNVIITEYSRSSQGFLVRAVDRIININWEDVIPPPVGVGNDNYLSAIARLDEQLIEMIDVEKVLGEVGCFSKQVDSAAIKEVVDEIAYGQNYLVVVADDSSVARNQIVRVLNELHIESVICSNGREALDLLKGWADENSPSLGRLLMVISDIEMPAMDGYTLTSEIRKDDRLKNNHIVLHTSLSGVFNTSLTRDIGADGFISKFSKDDIAQYILRQVKVRMAGTGS